MNIKKNVYAYNSNSSYYINFIDEETAIKAGYEESIFDGKFYKNSNKNILLTKNKNPSRTNLDYRVKHLISDYKNSFDKYFKCHEFITDYFEALEDTSFGYEIETSIGLIPQRKIIGSGLIPLKDGSISGIEYTSIPLQGKNGFSNIFQNCELLNKYTEISTNDSLHLHLGNIPKNENFICSFYLLAFSIQEELYQMFPFYYRDTRRFKNRNHAYNNSLLSLCRAKLDYTFSNIYTFISGGESFNDWGYREHKNDPDGNHKWRCPERYYLINLVPYFFGYSGTIEFRIHLPSINPNKIAAWLLLCNSIIKTAKQYQYEDLYKIRNKITLDFILDKAYKSKFLELSEYLKEYVVYRKRWYKVLTNRYKDNVGKYEIINDKHMYFNNDIKTLF